MLEPASRFADAEGGEIDLAAVALEAEWKPLTDLL